MRTLSAAQIEALFSYSEFIPFLERFLSKKTEMPERSHFDMQGNTLLLMPAWNDQFCGVKIATASPNNRSLNLPTIHAAYTLFDVKTGQPLVQMDGKILTNKRTAAASALASQHLSRVESQRLLVIGNGALCPELILAHAATRTISKVEIWGRNEERVQQVLVESDFGDLQVSTCKNLEQTAAKADVISCCTSSPQPVFFGKWLQPGSHLDLVGSYRPDMRETDDEAVGKATVFVDNPAALHECGDILLPLQQGILEPSSIATLTDLATGQHAGRSSDAEITLFKSVGFALEDLAIAIYLFEKVSDTLEVSDT